MSRFMNTLHQLNESPQADNHVLQEYNKWCNANKKKVGNMEALKEFASSYYNNAKNIIKFISSVITIRD